MADLQFIELCLKRRRNELTPQEFSEALETLLQDPNQVENLAIDVEALHGNQIGSAAAQTPVSKMTRDDDWDVNADRDAMREDAVAIRSSVAAARRLIDQLTDGREVRCVDDAFDELTNVIDEAQGAVGTGACKKAYIILIIE